MMHMVFSNLRCMSMGGTPLQFLAREAIALPVESLLKLRGGRKLLQIN